MRPLASSGSRVATSSTAHGGELPKTEQAGRADHSGTTVRKRFLALDSWRGLCALWIAAYHFRVVSDLSASHFVRSGVLAVDFFFVLSGFVIWHGFGKQM